MNSTLLKMILCSALVSLPLLGCDSKKASNTTSSDTPAASSEPVQPVKTTARLPRDTPVTLDKVEACLKTARKESLSKTTALTLTADQFMGSVPCLQPLDQQDPGLLIALEQLTPLLKDPVTASGAVSVEFHGPKKTLQKVRWELVFKISDESLKTSSYQLNEFAKTCKTSPALFGEDEHTDTKLSVSQVSQLLSNTSAQKGVSILCDNYKKTTTLISLQPYTKKGELHLTMVVGFDPSTHNDIIAGYKALPNMKLVEFDM